MVARQLASQSQVTTGDWPGKRTNRRRRTGRTGPDPGVSLRNRKVECSSPPHL